MNHHAEDGDSPREVTRSDPAAIDHAIAKPSAKGSARRKVWGGASLALIVAGAAWGLWPHIKSYRHEFTTLRKRQAAAEAELRTLRGTQARLEFELHGAQARARDLAAREADLQSRLGEFAQEHDVAENERAEFREIADQFESMIDSGNLDVSYHRGRMVLELPAQLLFPSGSADLTAEGSSALAQVAKTLRRVRSQRFLVAGHTDNLPVSGAQFGSNWELSVMRALHVTQALIAAGVRPQQLMTGGRAQYEPVASNATERGRQRNRRIEIVVEPYLAKVEPHFAGLGEVDVD